MDGDTSGVLHEHRVSSFFQSQFPFLLNLNCLLYCKKYILGVYEEEG